MKKYILLLLTPILILGKNPNKESIKKDLYYLADDKLEGREAGTKGGVLAIEYIEKRFKEMGLTPKGSNGYRQSFKVIPKGPHGEVLKDKKDINLSNVIGFIDSKSKNTIVIGSHFDHLGFGNFGSLSTGKKEVHNGADDNASGVSSMLELANLLKDKKLNSNILFIAFTGEEKGLLGSNYFVNNPTIDLKSISSMVNLDMVGRLKDKKLAVYGTGTSIKWDKILDKSNNGVIYSKKKSGMGPSDYSSFYLKNIPVLHFFTGAHKDYHKPTDDVDKINFDGMVQVTSIIENTILEIDKIGKLDFIKTKDESARRKMRFKVTLGVMPDYMYSGIGMKINGVKDNKPAKNAGIEAGDIVLKMGKYEIKGMKEYMKCLSIFDKGQEVIVIIKRGDMNLEKTVKF